MFMWKMHLRMGLRIPLGLRSAYILDIYNRARLKYRPQVYRGRTVLFRGEQLSRCYQKDWDGLLEGHLERFNLGEVDHMKLREEAYVHLWARQLKDFFIRGAGRRCDERDDPRILRQRVIRRKLDFVEHRRGPFLTFEFRQALRCYSDLPGGLF